MSENIDENKWLWNDTKLKDEHQTVLTVKDIKQLLINRNDNMKKLKITKQLDLIIYLKQNHSVKPCHSFQHLTKNQLFVELKLRGLWHKNTKSERKQWIIKKLQTSKPKRLNKDIPIIPWSNTEWKQSLIDRFNIYEIQQLLITRGAHKNELNGDKYSLIKHLKEKYTVNLDVPIKYLTYQQIKIELKLFQNNSYQYQDIYTKDTLFQLLNAAITRNIKTRLCVNLKHDNIPFNYSKPIKLNNDEFVIVTENNAFYKYNVTKNEWIEWIKYPPNCLSIHHHEAICVDTINAMIYMFYHESDYKMLKINYKTHQFEIYTSLNLPWLKTSKLLFIDQQIHLFGNIKWMEGRHWIFDHNKCEFNKCYDFKTYPRKIIHIISKNMILKIGDNDIETYDIMKKKWNVSTNINIPNICSFGAFYCLPRCRDERYLIISKMYENIAVLDLKEMKLYQTDIRFPAGLYYEGIIMNDSLNEELIVFGFLRQCWNKYKIGEHIFPPTYIIKLMQSWYSERECLHIIQSYGYCTGHRQPFNKHLKIRVDDILEHALKNNM